MGKIIFQKFQRFLFDFGLLFLYTVLIFILIRIGEYLYVINHATQHLTFHLFITKSVKYDTLFVLISGAILLLPAFLIALINFKTYKLLIRITLLLIIFIQLVFTQFFLTNNAVLTAVLSEFTFNELYQIASKEVSGNRSYFWFMDIGILLFSLVILNLRHKRIQTSKTLKNAIAYTALWVIRF